MNNAGIHFILILSLVILAVLIIKAGRRRQNHSQYVTTQANRLADAAEQAGGYENFIEIERQRRQNRNRSNPNN